MLDPRYPLRTRLIVSAVALLVSVAACKKSGQEPSRTDEAVAPGPAAAPNNLDSARPDPASANGVDAGTSTITPEFAAPLAPSPKELEANRAAAEEYYRSPQGASGAAGQPSDPH